MKPGGRSSGEYPGRRRTRRTKRIVDRGPQPIADALDYLVSGLVPRRAGSSTPQGEATRALASSAAVWGTVFSRWEDLVGPGIARHARPLRLEAGVLIVAVDLPPWATQVRALGPGILASITEHTGESLECLEVVVRP